MFSSFRRWFQKDPQPSEEETPVVWTDDLAIPLKPGRSVDELVDFVVDRAPAASLRGVALLDALSAEFGLSFENGRFAIDRIEGGKVRSFNPDNQPDARKDPIAYSAFLRFRGLRKAVASKPGQAVAEVDVSIETLDRRVEALIARRPAETGYAVEGREWYEALELADVCQSLATRSEEHRAQALHLAGRVTTNMLGHCYHRVARAMLASARYSYENGDAAAAASFCDALIEDLGKLVLDSKDGDAALLEEEHIAVDHILQALELRRVARGEGSLDADGDAMRVRCQALLAK